MIMKYLFTVIMRPHTWFELETVDFSTKKYLFWDEYGELFLPTSSFYSWIENNHKEKQVFRIMNKLKWEDLKSCEKITDKICNSPEVDFHYINCPVFYNEELAKQYLSQLRNYADFEDYKVLSIYANAADVLKASLLAPPKNRVITKINWNGINNNNNHLHNQGEATFLGFDIQNIFDFGRNLRYHIAPISEKYSSQENKYGLINNIDICYKIIAETDLSLIQSSSYSIINGERTPCYQTKEEWIPIGIKDV